MKFRIETLKTLKELVRELSQGLQRLTLGDNFQGFETTVVLTATTEVAVRNQLSFIPTRYIIVSQEGNGLITKGTTAWSDNFLYLYNNGAVTVTATIFFMR